MTEQQQPTGYASEWHCPTCGLVLHTGAWFGIHPPRCERCNPTTTHTQTVTTGSPGSTATLKVHAGAVLSSGTTVSVPAPTQQSTGPATRHHPLPPPLLNQMLRPAVLERLAETLRAWGIGVGSWELRQMTAADVLDLFRLVDVLTEYSIVTAPEKPGDADA